MKKIISVLIALLLAAVMYLPVYADMGGPIFDDWYVVCGVNGFDFDDFYYNDNDEEVKIHEHIEPGIRLQVYDYIDDSKEYTLVIVDERFESKGRGIVSVRESELEKRFVDDKKTVSKETGKALEKEVDCVVTSNSGIVLRQGPAKTFKKYTVIPKDAKISYKYTYEYGGLHWGFTTYNGRSGWTCIDYTGSIDETTSTTAVTIPSTTVAQTQETTEEHTAAVTTDAETSFAGTDEQSDAQEEGSGFFSNTKVVVVVCCLGAVILALTATVILLIVKRKKA